MIIKIRKAENRVPVSRKENPVDPGATGKDLPPGTETADPVLTGRENHPAIGAGPHSRNRAGETMGRAGETHHRDRVGPGPGIGMHQGDHTGTGMKVARTGDHPFENLRTGPDLTVTREAIVLTGAIGNVTIDPDGIAISVVTPPIGDLVTEVTARPGIAISVVNPPIGDSVTEVTVRPGIAISEATPPIGDLVTEVTVRPGIAISEATPPRGDSVTEVTVRPGIAISVATPPIGDLETEVTARPGIAISVVTPPRGDLVTGMIALDLPGKTDGIRVTVENGEIGPITGATGMNPVPDPTIRRIGMDLSGRGAKSPGVPTSETIPGTGKRIGLFLEGETMVESPIESGSGLR